MYVYSSGAIRFMANKRIKMTKRKLIPHLYELQGDMCPLCLKSLHKEIKEWVAWSEQRRTGLREIKRTHINLNIDHIIPVAKGGGSEVNNLALTHARCNSIKGDVQIYDKAPRRSDTIK